MTEQTAMMKLIEFTQLKRENGENDLRTIIWMAEKLLEEEKKQLVDMGKYFANFNGIEDSDIEDFYNQKYKP